MYIYIYIIYTYTYATRVNPIYLRFRRRATQLTAQRQFTRTLAGLELKVPYSLQLLMNRYGYICVAHVHERVSTQSFVVLIICNSKPNHLGAQGTFKTTIEACDSFE